MTVVGIIKEHVTDLIGQMEIMARSDPEAIKSAPRLLGGKVTEVQALPNSTIVTFDDGTGSAQAHILDPVRDQIGVDIQIADLVVFEGHVESFLMPDRQYRILIYPYLAFKIEAPMMLPAS